MRVWELRAGDVDNFAMIVPSPEDTDKFDVDGHRLHWLSPPVIEYADSRSRGKKKRPVADVATPGAGALVLSKRAHDALGPFLARFGQLLLVQTAGGGEFRHFYNVTNFVKCVNAERSEKDGTGALANEVFYDLNVPREPAVFKDPLTASEREELEALFRAYYLINHEDDDPCAPIDPVTYVAPDGDTGLHIAAQHGDLRAVELLVQAGLDVNRQGDMGYTALQYALTPAIVAFLLSQGARVDVINEFGKSPIGWNDR